MLNHRFHSSLNTLQVSWQQGYFNRAGASSAIDKFTAGNQMRGSLEHVEQLKKLFHGASALLSGNRKQVHLLLLAMSYS